MNFGSHDPLIQKLGVVTTRYERPDNIVTDEKDRQEEIKHINKALLNCIYLPRAFKQVREMQDNKLHKDEKNKMKKEKKGDQVQTKSMVTIQYVKGVSESL